MKYINVYSLASQHSFGFYDEILTYPQKKKS